MIKVKAQEIGFDLCGVTDCSAPEHIGFYRLWLSESYHGEMLYLERHLPIKEDPTTIMPEALSIIVVACNYYPAESGSENFKIARYAYGDDYHLFMKQMLEQLAQELKKDHPNLIHRSFVDSGPLMERDLASRSGLGFAGKNTCIIKPGQGSWFLLGCLLTNLAIQPDNPFAESYCGTCTRCMDACPTNALIAPYTLDATRCLSYWNIEQREVIPEDMRTAMGDRLFGCDICQEVCPWNQRFATPTKHQAFYPRAWLKQKELTELVALSPKEFELIIAPRSPIKRPKYRGFIRNIAVVMGNQRKKANLPALLEAKKMHHLDPMLQIHLDWAIKTIQNA